MQRFDRKWRIVIPGILLALVMTSQAMAAAIGVGAGFAPVVEELMQQFVAGGGQPMEIVPAATGTLAQQMAKGAPYELYLGDGKWADWLEKDGKITDKAVFALGLMVIWAPASFDTLPEQGTFAIPDPESTAYGPLAKAFLEKRGLWEKAMAEGRVLIGGNAPQTVLMAEKGTADVAFIPATQAASMKKGFFVPVEGLSVKHVGGLAPNASDNVKAFWAFLRTPEAGKVWETRGFGAPTN